METEPANTAKSKKFHYAWLVFGVCFLMVMVTLGFGSSQKSTFLKAITSQLGLSRGGFAVNDVARFLVTAVLNFSFGMMIKKMNVRWMILIGFLSLILSCLINANATDYWHFYVGGALLGAGLAWTTTTMVGFIVGNWFTNNKGTMMGIILAANGLGGFLSEPIVTKLIYGPDGSLSDADARWRMAYYVIAALFAVVAVIVLCIVRGRPEEKGLQPLGQEGKKKKQRGAFWTGYELKDVLKKPFFYIAGFAVMAVGFTLQAMSSVAKPHMYDIGLSKDFVISAFMLHSLLLMVAKMLFGYLFDRVGIRPTYVICAVCAVAALTAVSFISTERSYLAYFYSVISSFGLPLETVMIPLLVAELFGRKAYSHILGYFLALNYVGYALGSVVTNTVYDLTGTYHGILIVLTCTMLAAACIQLTAISMAKKSRQAFEAAEAVKAAEG